METLHSQAISSRINYNLKSFSPNFGTVTSAGGPQKQNTIPVKWLLGMRGSRMGSYGVTGFPRETGNKFGDLFISWWSETWRTQELWSLVTLSTAQSQWIPLKAPSPKDPAPQINKRSKWRGRDRAWLKKMDNFGVIFNWWSHFIVALTGHGRLFRFYVSLYLGVR